MENITATIETNKGQVLYVKVPNDAKDFSVTSDAMNYYLSYRTKKSKPHPYGYNHIKLPFKLWSLAGYAFSLTSEQVNILGFKNLKEFKDKTKEISVFEENPFPKPRKDDYSFYTHVNISVQEEWTQAEIRSGKWIVLFNYKTEIITQRKNIKEVIHYSWTSKEQNQEEWSHTFCGLKNADRLKLTDKVKNTTCKNCLKSLKK